MSSEWGAPGIYGGGLGLYQGRQVSQVRLSISWFKHHVGLHVLSGGGLAQGSATAEVEGLCALEVDEHSVQK